MATLESLKSGLSVGWRRRGRSPACRRRCCRRRRPARRCGCRGPRVGRRSPCRRRELTAPTSRSASSGCSSSTPVSMTATRHGGAAEDDPHRGKLLRAAHHSTGVFGAVPIAVSGVMRRDRWGSRRGRPRCSTSTSRHARVGTQAHGVACRPSPGARAQGDEAHCWTLKPESRATTVTASARGVRRARQVPYPGAIGDEQAAGLRPLGLRLSRRREDEPDREPASVAERELRVLAHLVRGPRRVKPSRTDPVAPRARQTNSSICSETCGPIGHAGVVSVNVTSTSRRRSQPRRSARARRSRGPAPGR